MQSAQNQSQSNRDYNDYQNPTQSSAGDYERVSSIGSQPDFAMKRNIH